MCNSPETSDLSEKQPISPGSVGVHKSRLSIKAFHTHVEKYKVSAEHVWSVVKPLQDTSTLPDSFSTNLQTGEAESGEGWRLDMRKRFFPRGWSGPEHASPGNGHSPTAATAQGPLGQHSQKGVGSVQLMEWDCWGVQHQELD